MNDARRRSSLALGALGIAASIVAASFLLREDRDVVLAPPTREIESAADAEEPAGARAHIASLKAEWDDLAKDALTPEITQRRAAAEARLAEREVLSREEDAKVAAENLARLTALTEKL